MINVSETLPLRTIKVNKSKFTLEIGLLNGSQALLARVALMQRLWIVELYEAAIAFDSK